MTDDPNEYDRLETEIRDLLAELGVHPRDLEERPGEAERAESDLAAILEFKPEERSSVPTNRNRFGRTKVVGFFAAAAVVALGLVLVRPWMGNSPAMATTPAVLHLQDADSRFNGGSAAAAQAEFRKLAAAAGRQPELDGAVQRTTLNSWLLSTDEATGKAPAKSVLTPVVSERFYLPDGKFRTIEHRGSPLDINGRVTDSLQSMMDKTSDTDETFDGPEEGPDYADRLETDPRALYRQLVDPEECEQSPASCLVSRTTFLHYNYAVAPRTSAALWLTLAESTGFTFLGETRDRLDRPAVAFAADGPDPATRRILLADPKSGAVLGSEDILIEDSASLGLRAPAVIEFIALVDTQRTSRDQIPDPSLTTVY